MSIFGWGVNTLSNELGQFFTELVLGNGGVNTYMGAATKYADVAAWSRKLSSAEISDLYAAFATMSSVETTVI